MTENENDLTKEQAIAEMARNNLLTFCEVVDPRYQVNWHHEIIAEKLTEALEKALRNEKARIIIEMPPRHGKSELATIKFPAWVLGKYPDLPIIVSSYSSDLAQDFGRKTRDLINEPEYHDIFNTRLREDVKAVGKWLTALVKNGRLGKALGSYTATGVGGSITGKGFKIGIIDDPFKNRKEADSEVYRDGVWNWYQSTFYTRQEGNGAIILILTRWHEDDLAGRLIEKMNIDLGSRIAREAIDMWEIIRFPAIAEENEMNRDKGDALWPEKYDITSLRSIENNIGGYEWSALYQQTPIATEKAEFKEEYFLPFEEREWLEKKNQNIDIIIDPAISEKKDACNSAIVSVGKAEADPDWFLLDYEAQKLNPGALIDATFKMYEDMRKSYPRANIKVYVETVAYQKALMYFFREEMKRRQIYFNLIEFRDSGDKFQRIRGLIPLAKTGVLRIRSHMRELIKEAISFPKGKTVDILDAISFKLEYGKNTKEERRKKLAPDHVPMSEYEG